MIVGKVCFYMLRDLTALRFVLAEGLGNLRIFISENCAQQEDDTLSRRQAVQHHDKCEKNGAGGRAIEQGAIFHFRHLVWNGRRRFRIVRRLQAINAECSQGGHKEVSGSPGAVIPGLQPEVKCLIRHLLSSSGGPQLRMPLRIDVLLDVRIRTG